MSSNLYELFEISPLTDFDSDEIQIKLKLLIADEKIAIATYEKKMILNPQNKEYIERINESKKKIEGLNILLDMQSRKRYNNREDIKEYIKKERFGIDFSKKVNEILKKRINDKYYVEYLNFKSDKYSSVFYIRLFKLTDKWIELYCDRANRVGDSRAGDYEVPNAPYFPGRYEWWNRPGEQYIVPKKNLNHPEYLNDLKKYGFKLFAPDELEANLTLGVISDRIFAEKFKKKHGDDLIQEGSGYGEYSRPTLRRLVAKFEIDYRFSSTMPTEEEQTKFLDLLNKIYEYREIPNIKDDYNRD